MKNPLPRTLVLILLLFALSPPALAGGWATVRLDESPDQVVAGEAWRFGFVVKQHDRTPTDDVQPVVRATHMGSGDVITASATQIGEIGHFEAELTFPVAGDWKWQITPEPFGPTSLETLTVVSAAAAPGKETPTATFAPAPDGFLITISIAVEPRPANAQVATDPAPAIAEVTMAGTSFAPARLEVAPGTEVVWSNTSSLAHVVMSDNLAFHDSGILDPGDNFRQVFTEPGIYHYWCGPHPGMTGTIVVTEEALGGAG